jgi:hypothetical protein
MEDFESLPTEDLYYAIISLFAFFFILGVYFSNRAKELQNIEAEDERQAEIEKTRIANEMHDDLGADLSNLLFKLRIYQNSLVNHNLDDYQEIEFFTKEIIKKVNETIWTLNSEKDNLLAMGNFMLKFSEEFVSKFNINFQFINNIETQTRAISVEKRRNIFYLYKEIMKSMTSVEGLSYLRVRLIYNNNVFSFKIQTQSSNSTKNNDVRIMLLDSIQHKVQNIKATYSEKLISVNEKEIWVHIKL